MYLIFDSGILDDDMSLLEYVLQPLEEALIKINEKIEIAKIEARDLDATGLLDRGEHLIGLAFTACQKYMSSTFRQSGFKKEAAFKLGQNHSSGESYAYIIHAVANYWKHCDEWKTTTAILVSDSEMMEIIIRDYELLEKIAKRTVNTIEKVSSWADYTCANVLAAITDTEKLSVLALIPILLEWRDTLINSKNS
jgi:hypothetical protein